MKSLTLFVSILAAGYLLPGVAIAEDTISNDFKSFMIAKSGCCKQRKSVQHPWIKIHSNFDQCKVSNTEESDRVYKSTGLYWWDRSC